MSAFLWVGIGGFIGSVSRYGVALGMRAWTGTPAPAATFAVNVAGCFLIGLLSVAAEKQLAGQRELVLFLGTGVLGGFTTFSTFGLDAIELYRENAAAAALYVLGSLAFGLAAVAAGRFLAAAV